jgi:hypothetical protein
MRAAALVLCLILVMPPLAQPQDRDERIANLEQTPAEARSSVAALQKTIELLSTEVQALRQPARGASTLADSAAEPAPQDAAEAYRTQVLRPDLGGDEREIELSGRPELFIQSRFQALPVSGATQQNAPSNFNLPRMESRWSGRVSDKVGMGFEIQYHPAPAGAPVELVNDAFVEY